MPASPLTLWQPAPPHLRFLRAQPWFAGLPVVRQREVEASVELIQGPKGQTLLPCETPVAGWYAVVGGLVKLQSQAPDGRVSVFLGIPPGQWFGEGSVLKKERRRYEVVALRETTLLCLPCPVFDALFAQHLPFAQALVHQLNHRLGQAMASIEASRTRSPQQRVALYLSRLFWYGIQKVDLSQEELGALVGLSRQTVNRALGELEQRGLLTLQHGRIRVHDDEGLSALVTGPAEDTAPEAVSPGL